MARRQLGHGTLYRSWWANNILGFLLDTVRVFPYSALNCPRFRDRGKLELTVIANSSFWHLSLLGKSAITPITCVSLLFSGLSPTYAPNAKIKVLTHCAPYRKR